MIFHFSRHRLAYQRYLNTEDGRFFLQERRRLLTIPVFAHLFHSHQVFPIIKAVIILRGLMQKEQVDNFLKTSGEHSIKTHGRIKHHLIREQFLKEVHFQYRLKQGDNFPIILPFFNRAMNWIYAQEPDKLYDYPYSRLEQDFTTSIIDAFEHYTFALFDSNFTQLVSLGIGDRTSRAYYLPKVDAVFIINQQGRLDVVMYLFDRRLKLTPEDEIPSRLKKALTAYFANNRRLLIESLYQEGFLTKPFYTKMLQSKNASFIQREKE